MRFWVDVENAAGAKLGDGPIASAVSWQNVARLDRAGEYSFNMPAADPRAALLQDKLVVRCWGQLAPGTAPVELGAGVVESVTVQPAADGSAMLQVAGGDLLRELTNRSVGFLALTDGAGGPTATGLAQLMALAPPGWGVDPAGYASTGVLDYASLAGESIMSALSRLAEHDGQHYRRGAGRAVRWLRAGLTASGIRAIQGGDGVALEGNPGVCLIEGLEEARESYDLITRSYGFGAGNANARLTLAKCARIAPAGYTLDTANSCLINTAAEAVYGRIERYLSWKEIAPISNSDADLTSAANVLYDAMYAQLSRQSAPQKSYQLTVAGLQAMVYPGDTIWAIYHRWIDGYHAVNIDADLCILEATTQIDQTGLRTVALQVSTVDQWPASAAELQASELERGRFMEAHPQLTIAYSPVGPYVKRVDATHNADFTVRVGKEVTNLNYAILRLKTLPLTSSVKSISGTATTTSSGGGGTSTSDAGGGGTSTSASGGSTVGTGTSSGATHDHHIDVINRNPAGTAIGMNNEGGGEGSLGATGLGLAVYTTAGGAHSHTINLPGHTHNVTLSDHSHDVDIPAHTHDVTPSITSAYGLYEDAQHPTGVSLYINGVNVSAALGGPWDAGGAGISSLELDITSYLIGAAGGLRQNHAVSVRCASGQGEVEAEVDMLLAIQAIAMV